MEPDRTRLSRRNIFRKSFILAERTQILQLFQPRFCHGVRNICSQFLLLASPAATRILDGNFLSRRLGLMDKPPNCISAIDNQKRDGIKCCWECGGVAAPIGGDFIMPVIKKLVASAALVSVLSAFGAGSSFATTLQTSAGEAGNQSWSGVGLQFTVNSAISVTSIGLWDDGSNGFAATASNPLSAYVMTPTGTVLITSTFYDASAGGAPQNGGYRFQNLLSPVTLLPGNYFLMGYGWTLSDQEHNSNLGGTPDTFVSSALVSYVNSAWTESSSAPGGTVPNQFGTTDFFSSANIEFAAATPLPAALPLFVTGLGALGLLGWRRKRKTLAAA